MTDDFNEGDKQCNELFLVLFGLFYRVFSSYNICGLQFQATPHLGMISFLPVYFLPSRGHIFILVLWLVGKIDFKNAEIWIQTQDFDSGESSSESKPELL